MEETKETVVENQEPTFDELLKNPNYQREFDKKLEGARLKWETKWQEKANAEKTEAERLAKMSESERYQEEISQLKAKNEELIASRNAAQLKDEAIKIATEQGVDVKLLELFDFAKESADSIKGKIELLKTNIESAVTNKVNGRLNQAPPTQVYTAGSSSEKAYLDNKYKNNPYYKK